MASQNIKGKVVILTQYFLPEMGAPQSRLFELATGLLNYGWDVKIFTALPNYPTGKIFKEYRNRLFKKDSINNLEVQRVWIYSSNSKKIFPRIISMVSFSVLSLSFLLKVRKIKPNYILVESPPLTLGLSGLALSKFSDAKLILNISDIWPLSALELGVINRNYLYKKLEDLEKYLYKKAFLCLGQSDEIVQHLGKSNAKRTLLFRNGVDPDRFEPQAFINNAKPLKIIYAGLLGVAQNVLDICEKINFKELELELYIYGEGNQKNQIIEFLSLNPNRGIIINSKIDRDQLTKEMVKYDAALVPLTKNIYGAVPSKIYEAMAAGLPIFYSGGGEAERIIKDHQVGWCSPAGNMDLLSQNLLEFKVSSEKRLVFKQNCINAAKSIFNRSVQIENLNKHLLSYINV